MIKICDIFGVNRYVVPPPQEMQYQLNVLQNDIFEQLKFLNEAQNSIFKFISYRAGENDEPGRYDLYQKYFKKEKLIYLNLNKCILSEYLINGEVWIPAQEYNNIRSRMDKYAEQDPNLLAVTFEDLKESREDEKRVPPTYFKTNDLIYPFQEIVNTYGTPRYQEANPALFAIVTFPFLFGVMFGDIGHGFMLFLFALYLCNSKDELIARKSSLAGALKARYLLLFMGFFAFYAGWMYNDFLSMPLNVFGTCYINKGQTAVKEEKDCVYPFGMDPKWYVASNELAFFNSLKMKLSVILGVIQMIFGIILRGMNAVHFNNYLDFVFEFIPQLIFMTTFFGYMLFMIFIKWSIDWSYDPSKAPNIISLLMNIFLKGGSVEGKPLYMNAEFQENIQYMVLIICLICIPFILIPKPLIVYGRQKKAYHDTDVHDQGVHHETLADLYVHQSIETIEFVLGSISNTASYLRLWALSLAHAQLAKVFFDKSLLGFVQQGNLFMVIIGFFIFANVTFAVLMCMDLMECFLHTLRLHWVEFQNKFFKADGIKFQPYSFKYLIEN
jgi:V-type H+-transporting ATPase subunit a